MINSILKVVRGVVKLRGATDNTLIGNYGDSIKTTTGDTSQLDSFGRMRTSDGKTVLAATFRYDKQPITWSELVASGGSVTHSSNTVSVDLACTTTTNSSAKFASRAYVPYHPGKSQLILISGNFSGAATNVTKRFGYFDDNNGVFFELSGSTLKVVRRTKTSGSVVDTAVSQSSWNIDKLDGTGTSGLTLDLSKQQLMHIDFTWLGSGRIRYGFNLNGKVVYCHAEVLSNSIATPWSQTANLPVRCEIVNAGSTASSMSLTCCSVICEGHNVLDGKLRTVNNGTTSRAFGSAGTVIPVLSLRKQTAYVDVPVEMVDFRAFADSLDDFFVSIVLNGTLTGASWSNVDGLCQKDVSATAISGGTTLYSTYLSGGASNEDVIMSLLEHSEMGLLGRDLSGNSDVISIVATAITSSSTMYSTLNYKEIY